MAILGKTFCKCGLEASRALCGWMRRAGNAFGMPSIAFARHSAARCGLT
jgi:hypothetical protein